MELEKKLSKSEIVETLKKLVNALETNDTVQVATHHINLCNADFEIEFEEEGGSAELELEFKWNIDDESVELDGEVITSSINPMGYYEIFKGHNSKWYFHLKAANHQIVLVSQGYKSKDSAENGIESVRKNAHERSFEFRTSIVNQPYFVLKAQNGEIIGNSQMYKRKIGAQKGMHSVIANAAGEVRFNEK